MPDQSGMTGQGRGYQQMSGLLHGQNRGKDHLDKKICREADEDHQRHDDIKPVVTVFAGIPGIIKNLFAAGTAPVGTLLTDKFVAAITNEFFGWKGSRHE